MADILGVGLSLLVHDFNHLDVKLLCQEFQLKQLVHLPTRGLSTLDLVLTNLHDVYKPKSAEIPPPRLAFQITTPSLFIRNNWSWLPNPPAVGVRLLRKPLEQIVWHFMDTAMTCEDKNTIFTSIISPGPDLLMPEEHFKFHRNDPPWINEDFKQLIKQRQQAFFSGNTILYKFYRNKVNRARKSLRENFYASKVSHLKHSKLKNWWSEVKRICGMTDLTGSGNIPSQLQIADNIDHLSPKDFANLMNNSFLESMKDYSPLRADDLFKLHLRISMLMRIPCHI